MNFDLLTVFIIKLRINCPRIGIQKTLVNIIRFKAFVIHSKFLSRIIAKRVHFYQIRTSFYRNASQVNDNNTATVRASVCVLVLCRVLVLTAAISSPHRGVSIHTADCHTVVYRVYEHKKEGAGFHCMHLFPCNGQKKQHKNNKLIELICISSIKQDFGVFPSLSRFMSKKTANETYAFSSCDQIHYDWFVYNDFLAHSSSERVRLTRAKRSYLGTRKDFKQ